MGLEIEKKYRLRVEQLERLRLRLAEVGAEWRGEEFEENTLFAGANLGEGNRALRLRRVGDRAVLTFKERAEADASPIKRQREDETEIGDAEALTTILDALGYRPALVYEKRRATWRLAAAEVVLDELPFGHFVEIEGDERAIEEAERLLNLADADAEHATYPQLTAKHGRRNGALVEARFSR